MEHPEGGSGGRSLLHQTPFAVSPRDRWYKDTLIYCLDVETFMDGNGDGVGDFRGLAERLDYLDGLGVRSLWLLPFYPSPNRDNGYDVSDYYGVDPRLGTLGDFVEFTHRAHERGIRIIVDLVVNHTSDQHPWFQQARSDPNSFYRDFYLWQDRKPEGADEDVVFPGVQKSTWSYDRKAKAYYHHKFYKHQPDLNIANPAVREEIERIMGFWLELGVSGFRMDAATHLIDLEWVDDAPPETNPYDYLRDFREFLSWRRGDAVLFAEANVPPEKAPEYFGDGNKLHVLFNFTLNQQLFLALARQQKTPLLTAIAESPRLPDASQWAVFIRNHDELSLDQLTASQREDVYAAFGPEEHMRLYDRGIRRRLPPMLDDERRVRMVYSLLFTLPGTPVLRYGEEIGMGEDLSLPERDPVRTPMQWSKAPNGGFSTAPVDKLVRPVISEGPYRYEAVNVADQQRQPDSLLAWMKSAMRTRKDLDVFGRGRCQTVDTSEETVFAHACAYRDEVVVAVHHLADAEVEVVLDLSPWPDRQPSGCLGMPQEPHPVEDGKMHLKLEPYGFRWFKLEPC